MTAQSRLYGLSPNARRAASLAVALVILLSLAMFVGAAPAPAANCSLGQQKCFKAEFADSATAGNTPLTLTNESPAGTQTLGAVKITSQVPITSVKRNGVSLLACPNPIDGAPSCTQGVGTTTVYIMNIGLPPGGSTTFDLGHGASCRSLAWAIEGRQSNKFQGSQNLFNLDATNSDLSSTVGGCVAAASFTVAFVDADPNASGVQRDAPDPVTSEDLVSYLVRITNTGGTAGSATLSDSTSQGTIVQLSPCNSTTGVGTGSATCTTASIGPGLSTDVRVNVRAPSAPGVMTNTASIGSSSDSETTTIESGVQQCEVAPGEFRDCRVTWHQDNLGTDVNTGVPNQDNPFAGRIVIPPLASSTAGRVLTFVEVFDTDGCGGQTCALGNQASGNMWEFGTLPAACGFRQCTIETRVHTSLLLDTTPGLCASLCVGWWQDDDNISHRLFGCNDAAHALDVKCDNGELTTSTAITFLALGSAGDGRTGYCVGTVCV